MSVKQKQVFVDSESILVVVVFSWCEIRFVDLPVPNEATTCRRQGLWPLNRPPGSRNQS